MGTLALICHWWGGCGQEGASNWCMHEFLMREHVVFSSQQLISLYSLTHKVFAAARPDAFKDTSLFQFASDYAVCSKGPSGQSLLNGSIEPSYEMQATRLTWALGLCALSESVKSHLC